MRKDFLTNALIAAICLILFVSLWAGAVLYDNSDIQKAKVMR